MMKQWIELLAYHNKVTANYLVGLADNTASAKPRKYHPGKGRDPTDKSGQKCLQIVKRQHVISHLVAHPVEQLQRWLHREWSEWQTFSGPHQPHSI